MTGNRGYTDPLPHFTIKVKPKPSTSGLTSNQVPYPGG